MNHPGKTPVGKERKGSVVALALTWDGARWPTRALTPKARAFLTGKSPAAATPSGQKLAKLLADDQVREIRVCWVPCLKGGSDVLSEPFQTATGTRLPFKTARTVRLGDVLGVIYRK
jgi:hypothetical protein